MTHDELLDKATNRAELEYCWMALQKVIKLHADDHGMCMTCEMKDYPCETIQIIEKELL
jgi:hypothetical protein